ncbi:MAG TPA: ATP-binding cassette domain-containing protein, partial [Verrucomicrobiae bacterium]|nr:ATP-binding cassette domain-containing protein [Verrucomicrobiae bacterium]
QRCIRLAELVGLGDRLDHRPTQLSGGQQQRVAIARSLINDPHIILADEPTGNLDTVRSEEILELLRRASERDGRAVLLVTHDHRAAAYGDRILTLRDGRIVDQVEGGTGRATVTRLPRRV